MKTGDVIGYCGVCFVFGFMIGALVIISLHAETSVRLCQAAGFTSGSFDVNRGVVCTTTTETVIGVVK